MIFAVGELMMVATFYYCAFHTQIEPSLIDLSIKYELNTRQHYEDVIHQTRASWLYEKPVLVWIGLRYRYS